MINLSELWSEAERRAWQAAPDIYCGREAICEGLSLPWATVWRLATAGGLPVQDLDTDYPSLAADDWLAWQRWDSAGGAGGDDEHTAQA